jgi:hypothetical protein
MDTIAASLALLPDRKTLHHFAIGLAVECSLFPSVVRAVLERLQESPRLEGEHRQLLQFAWHSVARTFASTELVSPNANAKWTQALAADSNAALRR